MRRNVWEVDCDVPLRNRGMNREDGRLRIRSQIETGEPASDMGIVDNRKGTSRK